MIHKCIECMKENLLLLKALLESEKRNYKYITSISRNAYIDKLDDIVNKHKNTYYSTIKIKPVDIKSSTYIDCNKEDPKFKVSDHVRISKYKNIFAQVYTPNCSEKVSVIKK